MDKAWTWLQDQQGGRTVNFGVDYQFFGAVQPLKEWVIYAAYMRE